MMRPTAATSQHWANVDYKRTVIYLLRNITIGIW